MSLNYFFFSKQVSYTLLNAMHSFQENEGSTRKSKAHSFKYYKEFTVFYSGCFITVDICVVLGITVKLHGDYLRYSLHKNICGENGSVYTCSRRSESDKG